MLLIVKNNSELHLRPVWYFTSPQIPRYLSTTIKGWDMGRIGTLLEAFATAGCDVLCKLWYISEKAFLIPFTHSLSSHAQGAC